MVQLINKIGSIKYANGGNYIYLHGLEKYLKVPFYLLIGRKLFKKFR